MKLLFKQARKLMAFLAGVEECGLGQFQPFSFPPQKQRSFVMWSSLVLFWEWLSASDLRMNEKGE